LDESNGLVHTLEEDAPPFEGGCSLVRLEALGWDGESHIKTMKMKAMIAPVFK
jgi:hypothetical protein